MKEKLSTGKKVLIILSSFALFWGATFSTDAILAHNSMQPAFAIKYPQSGGNTDTYIGLLYVVYVHHYVTGCPLEGPPCTYEPYLSVELHSWFYRE